MEFRYYLFHLIPSPIGVRTMNIVCHSATMSPFAPSLPPTSTGNNTIRRLWLPVLLLLFSFLPWVHPLSLGPSVSVVPLLFSWTCIGVLLASGLVSSVRNSLSVLGWGLIATVCGGMTLISGIANAGPEGVGLIATVGLVCACVFRFAGAADEEITALIQATLWAGVLSALIGLIQFLGLAEALTPWVSHNTAGEAYGNLRQRNLYASHLNVALCALLWLAGRNEQGWSPALVAMLASLLSWGNVLSHSRTGLFELLLIVMLTCWWGRQRHPAIKVALLSAVLTYTIVSLGLPWLAPIEANQGIVARFTDTSSPCMSRVALWRNVLELIAQRPWLGWGWGELDYAHMMHPYQSERFCAILDNAHNLPLHLAVELGVPCAVLVCLALLSCIVRLRPWTETNPARQLAWSILAVLGLHSLLEYPLWYGPFQLALGISLSLLWGIPRTNALTDSDSAPLASHPYPAWLNAILGLALLGGVAYAGWDYHLMRQVYLSPEDRSPAYRDDPMPALHRATLFRDHAHFAELTMTTVRPDNAEWVYATSTQLLHFSPEPRVLEKAIESATWLGRDQEALLYLSRFIEVYPQEHAQWQQRQQAQETRTVKLDTN